MKKGSGSNAGALMVWSSHALRSDFRATVPVSEGDPLRTAACHAFNDDATLGDADDPRVAQAGITGRRPCFPIAATIAIAARFADDGTDTVRADTQFHALCAGDPCEAGRAADCDGQRKAGRS